jgi:release factor glutamine methyltransferase
MRLLIPPGVFRPRSDSWLLADAVRERVSPGDLVLDVCTGSGLVAVAAAQAGGRTTAVDISRRAVLAARVNARLNGVAVETVRSDLLEALGDRRFHLIASNPPYLPGARGPVRGRARAWEGGPDGRAFLDRLIAAAPQHLFPGGTLIVVHSSVCGLEATVEGMRAAGLDPEVVLRHRGPLGPLLEARTADLERMELLRPGERTEDVAVLAGRLAA